MAGHKLPNRLRCGAGVNNMEKLGYCSVYHQLDVQVHRGDSALDETAQGAVVKAHNGKIVGNPNLMAASRKNDPERHEVVQDDNRIGCPGPGEHPVGSRLCSIQTEL